MATRQNKPKTDAEKQAAVEAASEALNAALGAAEPTDDEQPKPVEAKTDESTDDKATDEKEDEGAEKKKSNGGRQPAKKLALSEVEGDVADGAKVRIGVQSFAPGGGEVNRVLTVPTSWEIVGPTSRPGNVHARDAAKPDKTLCMLPTNWTSGVAVYPDGTWITCEPCARRLIAVQKLDQADHDKARQAAQDARDQRIRDEAARKEQEKADAAQKKAEEKAAAEQKAKEEAEAAEAKAAEEAKAAADAEADPKPQAKPDPKPTARQRGQRAGTRKPRSQRGAAKPTGK